MADLPADAVEDAERLTRLAREAIDDAEAAAYRARRDDLLAEHGYACRVREEERGETLVCYPADWLVDGVVDFDRVEDVSDAVEVSLSGPGDAEDWATVEAHNRALVDAVRDAHGDVHGDNAAALADFMGNHYARRIEDATGREVEEFRTEYFPRNAWPTDAQRAALAESIRLVFEAAGEEPPGESP